MSWLSIFWTYASVRMQLLCLSKLVCFSLFSKTSSSDWLLFMDLSHDKELCFEHIKAGRWSLSSTILKNYCILYTEQKKKGTTTTTKYSGRRNTLQEGREQLKDPWVATWAKNQETGETSPMKTTRKNKSLILEKCIQRRNRVMLFKYIKDKGKNSLYLLPLG